MALPSLALTRTFRLPRPNGGWLTVTLQPLPLGFQRRLLERGLVAPQPPVTLRRDSRGRPLRDDQGQPCLAPDEESPAHRAACEQYQQRVAALSLAECLKADARLRFDAQEPRTAEAQTWLDYADRLLEEMETAGFSAGDLARLCQFVAEVSNLVDPHLEAAEATFSGECPTDTT